MHKLVGRGHRPFRIKLALETFAGRTHNKKKWQPRWARISDGRMCCCRHILPLAVNIHAVQFFLKNYTKVGDMCGVRVGVSSCVCLKESSMPSIINYKTA